jgi:hypothetical protein
MVLLRYSGAQGTLIYEKNLKLKISCQTPFNLKSVVAPGIVIGNIMLKKSLLEKSAT